MPFNGQSPFLPTKSYQCPYEIPMCQCPSTGNPHFYANSEILQLGHVFECQCPSTGNPHFYDLRYRRREKFRGICVNALQRAIPISTLGELIRKLNAEYCVNALQRAIPISTRVDVLPRESWSMRVNALQRAIPISTNLKLAD